MSSLAMTPRPCALCPFRKDQPIYLRRERRQEIAWALLDGGHFDCHQTTTPDPDDDSNMMSTSASLICAGSHKALAAVGGSSQLARVAERLGMVDLDKIEATPIEVWGLDEWVRLAEGATGDQPAEDEDAEVETCHYVGDNCTAPAGYRSASGGVEYGTVAADGRCERCGEATCSECLVSFSPDICPDCADA